MDNCVGLAEGNTASMVTLRPLPGRNAIQQLVRNWSV